MDICFYTLIIDILYVKESPWSSLIYNFTRISLIKNYCSTFETKKYGNNTFSYFLLYESVSISQNCLDSFSHYLSWTSIFILRISVNVSIRKKQNIPYIHTNETKFYVFLRASEFMNWPMKMNNKSFVRFCFFSIFMYLKKRAEIVKIASPCQEMITTGLSNETEGQQAA